MENALFREDLLQLLGGDLPLNHFDQLVVLIQEEDSRRDHDGPHVVVSIRLFLIHIQLQSFHFDVFVGRDRLLENGPGLIDPFSRTITRFLLPDEHGAGHL